MARKTNKKLSLDHEGQADPKTQLDWQQFLASAQPVMKLLKDDLRARAKSSSSVAEALKARHEAERDQKRTADSFIEWQDHFVEQVSAAWMLSCVFVRTLEDRGLLGHARLAGPGASDSLRLFLELAPSLNERDYLLTIFRELTRFAATKDLFDARHNPIWLLTPSAEGAKALVRLFQQPRADLPAFRFGQSDTGFLGWIYQDLDEDVRARFALLQTPRFVESFILDRTLEPAIERFGLDDTTLIDPTCGSGHFLLGAFERLFAHRLEKEPGIGAREAAKKALDAVYGADLNPYAVAIARFRLTLAFFDKAGFARLTEAPAPPLHVVVADSLLHNPHLQQGELGDLDQSAKLWKGDEFALENEAEARAVLYRQFGAVVGNPPYIQVKDSALRVRYKQMYASAHREYSLGVPFTERFFQLARHGGRVGMITANSFMKREFGTKLIEQYLPTVNLDLVVNTSGAYIPGHGTPTVLLFGSSEPARGDQVSTVLASRGEPSTPEDPEHGLVWQSIAGHWTQPGFENEYISVTTVNRVALSKHPWSLGGGGAVELKALLEERAPSRLADVVEAVGFSTITGEDNVLMGPRDAYLRNRIHATHLRRNVIGEEVRDWSIADGDWCVWPNNDVGKRLPHEELGDVLRYLWPWRTSLRARKAFGVPVEEKGIPWWALREVYADRMRTPLTITFAFVATHNHFVLDRGGKVFKQSAPIIKLPVTATEDDHLALLAYLNSSTACFWMKQVCHNKSNASQKHHTDPARAAYEFAGTALEELPLPAGHDPQLTAAARELAAIADQRAAWVSGQVMVDQASVLNSDAKLKRLISDGWNNYDSLTSRAAYLQEEIDWRVYSAFGFLDAPLTEPIDRTATASLGARPFELQHGYSAGVSDRAQRSEATRKPVPTLASWEERIPDLQADGIKVIESREFKRMWRDTEQNVDQLEFRCKLPATWLKGILLDELEASASTTTTARPADVAANGLRQDRLNAISEFLGVASRSLLMGLLAADAVPFVAALRYTDGGMDRHAEWQHTWDLQRREDAGETIPNIPVPPKYGQGDYRSTTYWQLRGPLDVPKERFISYPGCESDQDHEPVYGWAGWDHEQRAKALATLYWNRKTEESWAKDRLTPMLAGLLELLPWLKQWHSAPSDEYAGESAANYYSGFLDGECRALGLTHEDLRAWRPAEKTRGKKAAAKPVDEAADDAPKPAPKKRTKKSPEGSPPA